MVEVRVVKLGEGLHQMALDAAGSQIRDDV
jgi:hypothetical protein